MNDNTENLLSILAAAQVMQLAADIQQRSMAGIAEGKGVKTWQKCEEEAINQLLSLGEKVKKALSNQDC